MSLSFAKPTTRTIIRTLIPIGTALLAFVVTGFLLLAGGFDPLEAYGLILQGSVGGVREVGETLVRTTSLLLTGLAVGFAFRCRVWNIGAEGQLYFGAIGAVVIALTVVGQIPVFGVIIAIIFAMIFGAGWAAIAGVLKSRLGVNEIIVTVMLNFIAILFVDFLVHGALKAPGFEPQTALIPLNIPTSHTNRGHQASCRILGGNCSRSFNLLNFVQDKNWIQPQGYGCKPEGIRLCRHQCEKKHLAYIVDQRRGSWNCRGMPGAGCQ